MKNLFGNKSDNKHSTQKDNTMNTLNRLTQSMNDMEEKIQFLENKKNVETQKARQKLDSGDKNAAKQALMKRKKYDEQIKQYDGAIMMMQEQQMMIEQMETLREVFSTVNIANQTLKEAQKGLTIDDINDIKDDMEDIKANMDDLKDVFAEYSVRENPDLDNELDKLANEMLQKDLPDATRSMLYYYIHLLFI